MAQSKKFHWVLVNRDRTPEIPKRFRVSAYPSMLVLGEKGENIHRFSSFMEPAEFLGNLNTALSRHRDYRAGRDWDVPGDWSAPLTPKLRVREIGAPSYAVPAGIVVHDSDHWVAQGDELFQLDRYGRPKRRTKIRTMTQDLACDGEHLYLVDSAWCKGSAIQVVDPKSLRVVREIVTKANLGKKQQSARGIAWREGKLWVSEIFGKLHEIDLATGEVLRTLDTKQKWLFGLAFDGTHLVAGGRDGIHLFDPKDGRVVRKIPTTRRLRAVGFHGGKYYAMAQPVFGFDRRHERIQEWPLPGQTKIYVIDPGLR